MKNSVNKLFSLVKSLADFTVDLLFPKVCVGCQNEGDWICGTCLSKIVYIKKPCCPKCGRLSKQGRICRKCRGTSNINGLVISAYYAEGPLKEAIHTFKYNGAFGMDKDLGEIITDACIRNKCGKFVVMPVPLHKNRKNQRGYNQSELLAQILAKKTNNKLIPNKLVRVKDTKPQVELSGAERRKNIKNAFLWKGRDEIKNQKVLLVDDVYTTGSTLEECAKVLKKDGASEIWAIVLAKV